MPRRAVVGGVLILVVVAVIVALALGPLSQPTAPTASPGPTVTPGATIAAGNTPPVETSQPTGRTGASASARPGVAHVWWIVMENHEYGSIIGSKAAPYINGLAAQYALLTNYFATNHPSEPNYIAMVAGSTLGVTTDGTYDLKGASIFSQLAAAGKTWRAYEQDIPPGCFTGSSAKAEPDGPGADGAYARKHDPAISFTYVSGSAVQCANIHPLRDFDPATGAFSFITPNLINDMHDGSIAQGDAFLRDFVPLITDNLAFASGVLFITFDEGSTDAGSHGDAGGHIATLVVAPGLKAGTQVGTYADHYSLLRTTQALLGLPCLAKSCERIPISY
ncbi:MAG TPA: alkaline phosphatase family protein [Candidatus Baltobacteraceae bacterium]|nr:alkaline phosphatase family protein [Candidatus Baltobacteraceae bacterium]